MCQCWQWKYLWIALESSFTKAGVIYVVLVIATGFIDPYNTRWFTVVLLILLHVDSRDTMLHQHLCNTLA